MFVLNERLVTLGESYSGKKNDQFTFELEGIPLDESEVNAFFGHPYAYSRLHCYVKGNTDYDAPDAIKLEPFLPGLKSLELSKALEGAFVQLRYGLSNDRLMRFSACKLSKITLSLGMDGETYLTCKVTAPPVLDDTLSELVNRFGKPILCEIRSYPPDAQKEMPLSRHGAEEQPDPPPEPEPEPPPKKGKVSKFRSKRESKVH